MPCAHPAYILCRRLKEAGKLLLPRRRIDFHALSLRAQLRLCRCASQAQPHRQPAQLLLFAAALLVRGRRCVSQTQPRRQPAVLLPPCCRILCAAIAAPLTPQPHQQPAPLLPLQRRTACVRPSLRLSDAASSTASSTAAASPPHHLCAALAAPLMRSHVGSQPRCCRLAAAVLVRGHRCASQTQPPRQPAPLLPL